jgi:hypothetical protein
MRTYLGQLLSGFFRPYIEDPAATEKALATRGHRPSHVIRVDEADLLNHLAIAEIIDQLYADLAQLLNTYSLEWIEEQKLEFFQTVSSSLELIQTYEAQLKIKSCEYLSTAPEEDETAKFINSFLTKCCIFSPELSEESTDSIKAYLLQIYHSDIGKKLLNDFVIKCKYRNIQLQFLPGSSLKTRLFIEDKSIKIFVPPNLATEKDLTFGLKQLLIASPSHIKLFHELCHAWEAACNKTSPRSQRHACDAAFFIYRSSQDPNLAQCERRVIEDNVYSENRFRGIKYPHRGSSIGCDIPSRVEEIIAVDKECRLVQTRMDGRRLNELERFELLKSEYRH